MCLIDAAEGGLHQWQAVFRLARQPGSLGRDHDHTGAIRAGCRAASGTRPHSACCYFSIRSCSASA
jgi:hypothetical protein